MSRADKPVPATVRGCTKTMGGAWALLVSIEGSKVRALVQAAEPRVEGARVMVTGSGSSWSLAA